MATTDENMDKNIAINWNIENFNFCWHKTGEYLESTIFQIHASCETFWKLLLYPRGEDDGEYISCYLFREKGGPEVVDVDFEFCLRVGETLVKPKTTFSKIYSFECHQREGLKCFVSRREVFAPIVAQKDRFTLTFLCNILKMDEYSFERVHIFFRTVIEMESISGIEVFDHDSSLYTDCNENIEIKQLLEDKALFNINLSHFEKTLVIKVILKSCRKIKYAICKISIIKHRSNENLIQHVRTWIGKISTDIWKYSVPEIESAPEIESLESSTDRCFLLHYDFAFSTGHSTIIFHATNIPFSECFDANLKISESADTALTAVENLYISRRFADVEVKALEGSCFFHKAILQVRCTKIQLKNKEDFQHILFPLVDINSLEKFIFFLYSDKLENIHWSIVHFLYKISFSFGVELLKIKSASYLKDSLSMENVIKVLELAECNKDLNLKNFAINYIIIHADNIFITSEWQQFSHSMPELARKIMLLKYKSKSVL